MRRPDLLHHLHGLRFASLWFPLLGPALLLAGIAWPADASAAAGQTLPPAVKQALSAAHLPNDAYAFVVAPVDGGPPLLSVNARVPMNPASVMKLVTTYAALELLGPAHSWQTTFLADAPPRAGVLEGPLYLKGNGDPRLSIENFWLLLRELRLRGVREIKGDPVLDRSAYALPRHDPAAFDNEPLRPYNAGADPLLVNFASLRFLLVADPEHNTVKVLQETPDPRTELVNRLALADGHCGDWRDRLAIRAEGLRIELSGHYAAACQEKALNLAPLPANAQVEGLFRALWSELRGSFSGQVRDGLAPATASLLAERRSAPLGELVRDMNKFSNNVMARHTFLALAPNAADAPATYDAARQHLRDWLQTKGIDAKQLSIENGAGLSRTDRISAEQLAALLGAAWKSPVMPELMASLPILGEDGTLKKRGNGSGRGRAHLKTGYIEGVRALAGYVLDAQGKRWVLVALINHPNATRGKIAIDALVDWVIQRPTEELAGNR